MPVFDDEIHVEVNKSFCFVESYFHVNREQGRKECEQKSDRISVQRKRRAGAWISAPWTESLRLQHEYFCSIFHISPAVIAQCDSFYMHVSQVKKFQSVLSNLSGSFNTTWSKWHRKWLQRLLIQALNVIHLCGEAYCISLFLFEANHVFVKLP